MQQSLALLRVALGDLLRVPGVNVGVAQKRLGPLTIHEGLDASGGIAKRPATLARQMLYRLLFLRRLDSGTLHGAYLSPNTHDGEVIHDAFDHGRIRRVSAAFASIKAIGISGVFEQLPGLLEVVAVRL